MSTRKINEIELPKEVVLDLETMFLARRTLSDLYYEQGKVKINYKFANIDEEHVQQFIRDESGYLQEEIFEAYELIRIGVEFEDHIHEEHADALHFWLEILLHSGIDYHDVKLYTQKLMQARWGQVYDHTEVLTNLVQYVRVELIQRGLSIAPAKAVPHLKMYEEADFNSTLMKSLMHLNIARNKLKNKYWKASKSKVHKESFHENLMEGFLYYIGTLSIAGYTAPFMAEIFLKKNIINIERTNGTTW